MSNYMTKKGENESGAFNGVWQLEIICDAKLSLSDRLGMCELTGWFEIPGPGWHVSAVAR